MQLSTRAELWHYTYMISDHLREGAAELWHYTYMISDHLREGAAELPDEERDGPQIRSRNGEDRAALLIREVNPGH